MRIIGLCGGSGSGKSRVAEYFLSCGIPVIDADAIYHKITAYKSPCVEALVSEFGESVITNTGALNRVALAEIVFAPGSESKRLRLNEITHKYVIDEILDTLNTEKAKGTDNVIIDAPLLFEAGLDKYCDITLSVTADTELRVKRIVLRDGITEQAARDRIASQIKDEELITKTDFNIVNNGTLASLLERAEEFAEKILKNKET